MHTRQAWVERCRHLRRAAVRGGVTPFVIVVVTDPDKQHVVGEVGIVAVDMLTWTGETSIWMSSIPHSGTIVLFAGACAALVGLSRPPALRRLLLPIAVSNQPTLRVARALGAERIAQARHLRLYNGVPIDDELWVIENTDRSREHLAKLALAGVGIT